jgi:hypothetical protein
MNNIELLDYVEDMDGNFWIANDLRESGPRGFMVYRVDPAGPRYNPQTGQTYVREPDRGIISLPKPYRRIFRPRAFYAEHRPDLTGVWRTYAEALNAVGIEDENIGIFGSYLLGFRIEKDVDFCIYGLDSLARYYVYRDKIKHAVGATSISPEHVAYQVTKYSPQFSVDYPLETIFDRNWSGIQLKNGVLSTPRFIDPSSMLTPPTGRDIHHFHNVEVQSGLTSALLPRCVPVRLPDYSEPFTLISPLWLLQSFARRGDILKLRCAADFERRLLVLDDRKNHSLKYLKTSSFIK